MRHASDSLHSWARHLTIGDARAKSVLLALCLYADHRAVAWPSVATLAADTEQSENTVRGRLRYLEDIGVVARLPRWSDDDGNRNGDSRGRRTSDDIQLITSATQEAIDGARDEKRSRGSQPEPLTETEIYDIETTEESEPVDARGSNLEGVRASPLEGGRSTCVNPLMNSYLRKEDSPPSPPSGGEDENSQGEKRARQLAKVYPDPITNWTATVAVLEKLSEDDFGKCLLGAKGYAAFLDRERQRRGRSRPAKNAHIWVKHREWIGFLVAGEKARDAAAAGPMVYPETSPEGRAVLALGRIARYTPLIFKDGGVSYRGKVTARLLALAESPSGTVRTTVGEPSFAAWRGLISEVFEGCNLPRLTEMMVPWRWPPSASGTIYTDTTGPPIVPGTLATDEDLKEFSRG